MVGGRPARQLARRRRAGSRRGAPPATGSRSRRSRPTGCAQGRNELRVPRGQRRRSGRVQGEEPAGRRCSGGRQPGRRARRSTRPAPTDRRLRWSTAAARRGCEQGPAQAADRRFPVRRDEPAGQPAGGGGQGREGDAVRAGNRPGQGRAREPGRRSWNSSRTGWARLALDSCRPRPTASGSRCARRAANRRAGWCPSCA